MSGDPETGGWFVYIIEADDGSLYTGVTTDVDRRFGEHADGRRGARFFAGRTPRRVVYRESGHDRGSALSREAAIKRLSRAGKLALIAADADQRGSSNAPSRSE